MSKSLRLIYAGTPEFAVPALAKLHAAGHEVVACLTQPDRPAGRGQKIHASPIKEFAQQNGIPVLQPLSLRKADIKKQLRKLNADVMIVAAYGLILPESVLVIPRLGCLNIHASILPRWRGAAPIQRAIEAGDETTGITIMQMDAGLDTGDVLSKHEIHILPTDTASSVHDKLSVLGADAIVETLGLLDDGQIKSIQQDDTLASYAQKLNKKEANIDWSESAEQIERKVRAFNPWPCAYTTYKDQSLRVWQSEVSDAQQLPNEAVKCGQVIVSRPEGIDVQTGLGILRIHAVQLAGRKRMDVKQFVNAHDLAHECFVRD
jgi:methionyl-tRNA formyltransferase